MLATRPPDEIDVPRLAEGVRLLGAYDSDGLTKPKFLAQRADGQVVLLSELLYLTASNLDGSPLDLVATQVSSQGERQVNGEEVAYLATKKLAPLGLVDVPLTGQDAPLTGQPKAAPILAMAGRGFLPAPVVRVVAWCLRPLFLAPVMAVFLVAMVLTDVWAFATQPVLNSLGLMLLHPGLMLAALGLLGVDTLWHEFGHATACRKGGGRPGRIGAGVYLMFPAFFTDVTDSYRLSRRARLRVDLGGVYFNATFISVLGVAWHLTGYAPVLVVLAFSNLTIIQQLVPVVRFDGYWVLSDLVGVPDLFARIKPALQSVARRRAQTDLTRKAVVIVSAWVAVIVPLLLVGMGLMLVRMPGFIATTYKSLESYFRAARTDISHDQWTALALAVLMMMFLLLPTVGLGILAVRSTKAVGGLVRSRRRPPYVPQHALAEEEAYVLTLLKPRPAPVRLRAVKHMQFDPDHGVKRRAIDPTWPKPPPWPEWWELPPGQSLER